MGKLLMRTNFSPSLDEKKCFKISQDREGISAKEREGKKGSKSRMLSGRRELS